MLDARGETFQEKHKNGRPKRRVEGEKGGDAAVGAFTRQRNNYICQVTRAKLYKGCKKERGTKVFVPDVGRQSAIKDVIN